MGRLAQIKDRSGLLKNASIRVGVLGGSFNPAHEGHRYISLEAIKRLGLDEVWWLVSPQNPLKSQKDMQTLPIRLKQARQVAGHPKIYVADFEKYQKNHYTYNTLLKLKEKFYKVQFVWLMGADNLVQFPEWFRWQDILATVPVAVFDRGGKSYQAVIGKVAKSYRAERFSERKIRCLAGSQPPAWVFVHMRKHPASATAIRKNWKKLV